MSITTSGVVYIINAIEDILAIIESQESLKITSGYDEKNNGFMKLVFSLKNGRSEINIFDRGGYFYYFDCNGEGLESISFNEHSLTDTNGSFHKALKAIIAFDRQQVSQAKNMNSSIDRASFGLAEVN
jgi:hypothetical protein